MLCDQKTFPKQKEDTMPPSRNQKLNAVSTNQYIQENCNISKKRIKFLSENKCQGRLQILSKSNLRRVSKKASGLAQNVDPHKKIRRQGKCIPI